MSLCTGSVLQASRRRAATFSKPTLLYLKRQLATEIPSTTAPLHGTPPSPLPPAQPTATPSVDAKDGTPKSAEGSPLKGGRRRLKSKYADGTLRTLETMPYTAYQAALKYLQEDRIEKLELIKQKRARLKALKDGKGVPENSPQIKAVQEFIEELQLNIDKNNPRVKYTYDNKKHSLDPHRPIYQHWDDEKWRSMKRKILMQRLEQMYVVPDLLQSINPIVDVTLRFRRANVNPGDKLKSKNVMKHPSVKVTPFDSKQRLVTVVVVDPDRPNLEKNGFDFYLQWMVTNCPVSITEQMAIGRSTTHAGRDEVAPYEVPYVYKGENYHRYCLFIFEQEGRIEIGKQTKAQEEAVPESGSLNMTAASETSADTITIPPEPPVETEEVSTDPITETGSKDILLPESDSQQESDSSVSFSTTPKQERIDRLGFNLRSFAHKHNLKAIGAHLWRVEFDENMMSVMKELGIKDWEKKFVKHEEFI